MKAMLLLWTSFAAAPLWAEGAASSPSSRLAPLLPALAAALGLPAVPEPAEPVPAAGAAGSPAPSGPPSGFRLVYNSARKPENQKWERLLRASRLFEREISVINSEMILPYDVEIRVEECGKVNAWWSPRDRRITYCYELYAMSAELLAPRLTKRDPAEAALGDVMHTLYHELGHALIDIYGLPTVGREEDAVDQFATVVLIRTGEAGAIDAMAAAMVFAESSRGQQTDFWDVHSFDLQRAQDILCLIYGSDPVKYADIGIPPERARTCPWEFRQANQAWAALLARHNKP